MGFFKRLIVSFFIVLTAGAFVFLAVQNVLNTKKINELQNQISSQIKDLEVSVNSNLNFYQQQVEAQQELLTETTEYVKSQTAIISRVVGDSIPVIIPSEFNQKFKSLKDAADSAFSKKTTDNAQKLSEEYLDYIRTTPSWIQNEQSTELFAIHSEIEFLSILYDYNENGELDRTIEELQNFILNESSFAYIDSVIIEYNRLVDIQNNAYEELINKALKKSEEAVALFEEKKDAAVLENALHELNLYSNDEKVSESITKITNLLEEAQTAEYIEKLEKYNQWAISTIDYSNRRNNTIEATVSKGFFGFGGASADEKERTRNQKKELLTTLETIDTSLLINPVNCLYQQVYSAIWNSLEQQDQVEVSCISVICKKRGLNDE